MNDFAKRMRTDTERWAPIIRASGFAIEQSSKAAGAYNTVHAPNKTEPLLNTGTGITRHYGLSSGDSRLVAQFVAVSYA
jgi:hypothetical protein